LDLSVIASSLGINFAHRVDSSISMMKGVSLATASRTVKMCLDDIFTP
jgi:hypothetical protein